MYTSFQESYYEKGERNPILNPSMFLTQALISIIDSSKQNCIGSRVDVCLEIEASENLTYVTAYCLVIHDRIIE